MKTPTIFQWFQILRRHHGFTLFQAVRGALWLAREQAASATKMRANVGLQVFVGNCEGVAMSAASSFMTHSNADPAAPATHGGVFTLADKSSMHESRQAQSSVLDTIVGQDGGLRAVLSQVDIVSPPTPPC